MHHRQMVLGGRPDWLFSPLSFVRVVEPITGLLRAMSRDRHRERYGWYSYELCCASLHLSRIFCKQNNHTVPWSSLVGTFLCGYG